MYFRKKVKRNNYFNRFRPSTHLYVRDTETGEILLKTADPKWAYEYYNRVCGHDKSRYVIDER